MAVLGAAAGAAFPQLTITASQTWTPPQDGTVCIHAVGGGGGAYGASSNRASGGAGAYFKIPSLAVTTSGNLTLVVGAGGNGSYNEQNMTAGGNTTVAGAGLTGTKTANGGAAGSSSAQGAGGTFSGSGESVVGYSGGAGTQFQGGAVGVFATGNAGAADWGSRLIGARTDAAGGGLAASGFGIICGGSHAGSAIYSTVAGAYVDPHKADDLCGGGSSYIAASTYTYGGDGGIGGGGGAAYASNSNICYGGKGGEGIILIQYLPW